MFLLLLSKEYVNNNAAKEFQLERELSVEYILTIAAVNAVKMKKVIIVKEVIAPIVEHVSVLNSKDLG